MDTILSKLIQQNYHLFKESFYYILQNISFTQLKKSKHISVIKDRVISYINDGDERFFAFLQPYAQICSRFYPVFNYKIIFKYPKQLSEYFKHENFPFNMYDLHRHIFGKSDKDLQYFFDNFELFNQDYKKLLKYDSKYIKFIKTKISLEDKYSILGTLNYNEIKYFLQEGGFPSALDWEIIFSKNISEKTYYMLLSIINSNEYFDNVNISYNDQSDQYKNSHEVYDKDNLYLLNKMEKYHKNYNNFYNNVYNIYNNS